MYRLSLALVLVLYASTLFAQAAVAPDPRTKFEAAIPEMIRLLEAKQHLEFVQKFAPPEQVKAWEKERPLKEKVDQMPQKAFDVMLRQIKATQGVTPSHTDSGDVVYTFTKPIDGVEKLTLTKVGNYWYVK